MSTHLIETSVLTRRSRPEISRALQPFWESGALARCTLSDLEVCFSASNIAQWDALARTLNSLPAVGVTDETLDRARAVQRMLAGRALKGRKVPDLIIAAAAELAGLTLLHYDDDFELIASVTGQPQEWIVPQGTIV